VLEQWARNQAMFNYSMALALPRVEIVSAEARELKAAKDSASHEIKVTVRNAGQLPTALEQAKRVKIVQPDRVMTRFASPGGRAIGRAPEFFLGGGQTQTVTLRVKVGDKPEDRKLTLRLLSTRGGVAEKEFAW